MKRLLILPALLILFSFSFAQKKQSPSFQHVEPPFWFVGMKNSTVQILFHNKEANIGDLQVQTNYQGVTIKEVTKVENPHYVFVTVEIGKDAVAGSVPFTFTGGKKPFSYNYELRNKGGLTNRIQGFNSSDVVYLIMPDRFANGDTSNDTVAGMLEPANRANDEGRHGGDLQGITNHLDYIKELGVTAIWLNPVLENNQKRSSYHGYAITDLYNVDKRFGGNEAYLSFINKSHAYGLKVIQDMVMNHIGNDHWLMHDLPEKNWIHQFPEFTRSNYQGNVLSDPYRSDSDSKKMNDGWFDTSMPDVDQTNPLFATYLIQNSLWWIEYGGLDGIRMDTHPYPDKEFMSRWAKAVMDEYPSFNIVGEVWLDNSIPATAYWQKGMKNKDGYESNLPTVTDFPFCFAVAQSLNEQGGWSTGMRRLYVLLSQDFIYPNAYNNLTFLDNHDMTRFFLSVGRDLKKFKMGITFLLTTRGIPELYYGTELLMDGDGGHHPNVRRDFPGGWAGDKQNAFTKEGRTGEQNEAFDFLKKLLDWRKANPVIHSGKLKHYIPNDNIYVYFRSNENKTVMVVMNANPASKTISLARFAEDLAGKNRGTDISSGEVMQLKESLDIPAQTALVLELE
jgi:neopullulanase